MTKSQRNNCKTDKKMLAKANIVAVVNLTGSSDLDFSCKFIFVADLMNRLHCLHCVLMTFV